MKLLSLGVFIVCTYGTYAKSSVSKALSSSYAPVHVECPSDFQWLRPAIGLNPKEANWVAGRKRVVANALSTYLKQLELEDFDVSAYIAAIKGNDYAHVPIMGYSISGGGWASAFTGIGGMRALDSRLDAANKQKTGGLLQCLTYMAGISGGSWPIMSIALNNFPTVDELVQSWHVDINRENATTDTKYAADPTTLFKDLAAKAKAGFNVSIADYLGRALAYEFIPGAEGGLAATFSDVALQSKFKSHDMPFPITHMVEIDGNDVEYFGLQLPSSNANLYDMTTFEFGSWQGIKLFSPMEYLGTAMDNGSPINESACVRGFDRASFIIGSAEDAFNAWTIQTESNGTLGDFTKRSHKAVGSRMLSASEPSIFERDSPPTAALASVVKAFNETFGLNISSTAYAFYPNPFAGISSVTPASAQKPLLRLVDGSETGQADPLWGQIQPARGSNFIITWDDNADQIPYNWNNGTNVYDTYLAAKAETIPFPIIPTSDTFNSRGYNVRPVFFGCDPVLTTTKSADSPILLYFGNAPYSAYTNYSYAQAATSPSQMSDILVNSFNEVTQGNSTLAADWPVCLGCAAIDRSLPRVGIQRTAQCEACMAKYCWDGTEDNATAQIVDPSLLLQPNLTFAEWIKTHDFQEG